jgi:AbrB family looped-hinge helix DNA binding protein
MAKMNRKGQVIIPKAIRDRLGVEPGDSVTFDPLADGRVALSKVGGGRPVSRFEALRGFAGPGLSTDQIMSMLRGED